MNVLVIGGSGFLSGTVVRRALADGHRVWCVTRGRRPSPARAQMIIADRADDAGFAQAIAAVDARWDLIVDCIGFTAAHARQDLNAFVGRASHLVFISTDSVLNPAERPWKLDETFDRYDTISDYGRGKREAELVLLEGRADAAARGTAITILRPCHIYGPNSLLGCLPQHGRDPNLIEHIRAGRPLRLVGGGHILQQPVFADDLARMSLSVAGNARAAGETYFAAGPEVVASWVYYRYIADALGVPMPPVEEVPITELLAAEPGKRHFCCHRVYAMDKAAAHGLAVPKTPLAEGLAEQVRSLLDGPTPSPPEPRPAR